MSALQPPENATYDIVIVGGIGSLVIGWILGLALIRQAKGHQAMME